MKRASRIVALSMLVASRSASGHGRSTSYARWELRDDGADVVARVSLLDLSRSGPPETSASEAALTALLPRTLVLAQGGHACAPVPSTAHAVPSDAGWAALRWRVRCPSNTGSRTLRSTLFGEMPAGHLHLATARLGAGPVRERVLTEADATWTLEAPEALAGAAAFFRTGVHHILSGPDHLAFLLALALPLKRWRSLLTAVTGFTLGHACSVTLAAAAGVRTDARAVESLIGLSVALVAAEDLWLLRGRTDPWLLRAPVLFVALAALAACAVPGAPALALGGAALFTACTAGLAARGVRAESLREATAALFGLVHGFGFAGALAGLELPRGHVARALLAFNAGVEAGQLVVLLLAMPVLVLLWRAAARGSIGVAAVLAAAGVAVGTYWFAGRVFFGA